MATEKPVSVVESVTAEVRVEAEQLANPAAMPSKSKKAKKVAAPRKGGAPTHPPYLEMIQDAIVTLNYRAGSSQQAITKFIEEKYKSLPPNFRRLLLVQLKKLVASDKLVKVKASFKLPATLSKPAVSSKSALGKKKPAAVVKPMAAKAVVTRDKKAPAKLKQKSKKVAAASRPKVAVTKLTAKPKLVTKPKAAAPKPKAAPAKRKEAPELKPNEKRAKIARTSTRTTPGRKPAPALKAVPKRHQ